MPNKMGKDHQLCPRQGYRGHLTRLVTMRLLDTPGSGSGSGSGFFDCACCEVLGIGGGLRWSVGRYISKQDWP